MPECYWSGVQTKIVSRKISNYAVNRAAWPMGPSEDEVQRHVVYLLARRERKVCSCSTRRIFLHDRLESSDLLILFNVVWFPAKVLQQRM